VPNIPLFVIDFVNNKRIAKAIRLSPKRIKKGRIATLGYTSWILCPKLKTTG
jgi:hypothetical protein